MSDDPITAFRRKVSDTANGNEVARVVLDGEDPV